MALMQPRYGHPKGLSPTDEVPVPHPTPPPQARASRAVRIVGYLLAAVLCLALLEVLSYLYLRLADGYDGAHLMNYQFDDYKNIYPTPHFRNTKGIGHNGQGFRRAEETPREKPAGVYRIFLMGGSTAYGLGSLSPTGMKKYPIIRNDQTIDYYLEQFLNAQLHGRHVEVINAGIPSHFSHHHLIYLNQTILKYHPDMVIFIDGYNDYYPTEPGFDQFRDYPYRKWAHLYLDEPTLKAWGTYSGWWLFRKSHLVYLAGKTLRPVWATIQERLTAQSRLDVDEAMTNLAVNAEANFLRMVERTAVILRHEGVVPVFTVQPEIEFQQSKTLTDFERRIVTEVNEHWPVNFVEFKNRARPFVVGRTRRAAEGTGGLFFDLTDIFGTVKEDAYTDHCHLSPSGNQALATHLGERLVSVIRRPSPTR